MSPRIAILVVFALMFSVLSPLGAALIGIHSTGTGDVSGDMFGSTVAYLPDFDGDGVYDIAVAAPMNDSNGQDSGAIFIFLGPITDPTDLGPSFADVVLQGVPLEEFGTAFAPGDYNGDGVTDILVGAPGHADETGWAYIFHGGNSTNRTSTDANATFKGEWLGQRFGQSVVNIGNLNGDIYDDFAIGAGNGNSVFIYEGARHLETPTVVIPELEIDYPSPVDFTNGINSTGNTFGLGNTTDGFDWEPYIYGGSDPDVHFVPMVNQGGTNTYLEIIMGNETTGNGMAGDNPSVSGGYGVEFDISEEMVGALSSGGDMHVRLSWTTREPLGGGNGFEWWHDEMYWVKCRFWNSSSNASYIGWNLDGDNTPADDEDLDATTDATLELFYVDWAWGSGNLVTYSYDEDILVNHLVDGAHTYYIDVGGKLSDWSSVSEALAVRIDDISIGVEFTPIAELLGPVEDAGYGKVLARAGDLNKDGYDDLMVGAPGSSEVHIYFGSPDLSEQFEVYTDWALPATQGQNDTTTQSDTDDLKYNDGGGGMNNYYWVEANNDVMDIDTWTFSDMKGEVIGAWLYMEYVTSSNYNGNNWVRWAKDGEEYQQTDLHPVNTGGWSRTNWNDADGPYPFHENGVSKLEEIQDLDLEFTNNDGGGAWGHVVYFDYAQIYMISQMASNITIHGPEDSEFGASMSALGNINGDHYEDIVIGAPANDSGTGAVFVFTGGKDLIGNVSWTDAFAHFEGMDPDDGLGTSVASAGKFSLDDTPDIAMGAPRHGNGTIYIVRGGPALESGPIDNVAQYSMEGESSGSRFPASIAALGDINGRHCGEILVGAPAHKDQGLEPVGRVYILYNTDEDILEQPLIIDYYPTEDPVIEEGESVDMGVVVNAPKELEVSFRWYLDSVLTAVGNSEFTYTSDYDSAGTHETQVFVSDGFRSENHSWTIEVLDVNFPPVVEFHPGFDPVMDEGDMMRFWVVAWDPDDDPLEYYWKVDGAQVQASGPSLYYGTDHEMAGSHIIEVNVSDGQHHIPHSWNVSVRNLNRAPIIDSTSPGPGPTMSEGEAQGFSITAHDPDGDELTVIWYIDGVTVATNVWEIEFEAEFGSIGPRDVVVIVSDGELSAQHTWDLRVTDGNLPPVIEWTRPESPVLMNEGEEVVFWISAYDPDGDNLTITWEVDGQLMFGNDMSYTFRPRVDPARDHHLKVTVSDGALNVTAEWDIVVNRAPVIRRYWPETGSALGPGQEIDIGIRPQDPDNDDLTVTWSIDGEVVDISVHPPTSSKDPGLMFKAPFDRTGGVSIKVVVTDGSLSDEEAWTFNLTKGTNTAPTAVIRYDPTTPKIGETISFDSLASTDLEGDIVDHSWTFSDGTHHSGSNTSRAFSERGAYQVTLTVTDSKGNIDSVTEVIVISGLKRSDTVESPWGMILFIILLIALVLALLYQANRKGWLPQMSKPGGTGTEKLEEEEEDLVEEEEDLEREEEEDLEDDLEPEDEDDIPEVEMEGPSDGPRKDPSIEGGFEEVPLDEKEDLD